MNWNDLARQAEVFLSSTIEQLRPTGLKLQSHWKIDHLCYRVETLDRYHALQNFFTDHSRLLAESMIGGRPISTFKIHIPISAAGYSVDLIELPAPKKGKRGTEGFEHFEVVIDQSFEELMSSYPHLNWELGTKTFNNELELKLEGRAIKFHHLSLEEVIRIEHSRGHS